MSFVRNTFESLKSAASDFGEDAGTSMAAAISYYTVFSLPPLLVLILMLASVFMDPATVREMIQGQFAGVVGPEVAATLGTMIENVRRPGSGGVLATILGIATLFLGAAGAFSALQQALNRAWEVRPDPEGGLRSFVTKRLFSYGMVLGIAFLLLVSLVVSAALSAFGAALGGLLPGGLSAAFVELLNNAISFAVIALLFAAIYKVIPDAEVTWGDVWAGAIATALLFTVGKFLIGLYLGRSDPGSAFGAAGSIMLLFVWIYYSAIIVIYGAEFTQAWAARSGKAIEPSPGAVRLVEKTVPARGEEGTGETKPGRPR